jgi:hypothetical protein
MAVIGLREVELASASRLSPFREKRCELRLDLRPDLIAAGSNARTDSRVDVRRSSMEIMAHAFEGTFHKLRGGSAPARMDRRNSTRPAIQEQNGDAISGSDTDTLPKVVSNESIALGVPIFQWMCVQNQIRVDLSERDISWRIRLTGAEAVCLPNELLQRIAAIDPI